jgi:hypothetical protein
MKTMVYWVVTACSLEKAKGFGGPYCPHIDAPENDGKLFPPVSAAFLLSFLLGSDDEENASILL